MMKFFVFLISITFSASSFSKGFKAYYFKSKGKVEKIFFKENEKGFLLNKPCHLKRNCEALKNAKFLGENFTYQTHKDGYVKNPFSQTCTEAEGVNLILEDKNLNEIDFCKFKDNTMILSEHLFNARFRQ